MSAIPLPPRAAYTSEPIYRLTVEQYHELIRSAKLTADDPVELVEGILVFKMPKGGPHATSTGKSRRTIEPLLPAGWHYRVQEPVTLVDGEPEPDGAVVRGDMDDYADGHPLPADVALVIEVADSTLTTDRTGKLRSYARAGIPVYWIVNLVGRQVELYTDPDPVLATYRGRTVLRDGAAVPLTVDGQVLNGITVAAILPPDRGPGCRVTDAGQNRRNASVGVVLLPGPQRVANAMTLRCRSA